MPATAGRVRMPANNRVHSSAALQTHGIWQSAIGYDPYAPDQKQPPPAAASGDRPAPLSTDQQNMYDSFQGLLALARLTGSNADEARGACRKCGRVGHLPFQCRNFLKDEAAVVGAPAGMGLNGPGHGDGGKNSSHRNGHKAEADSDDSSSDEEVSDSDDSGISDSSADSVMERAIAGKFGKNVLKSLCKKSRSVHSKELSSHRRSHSKTSKSKRLDDRGEKPEKKSKGNSSSKRGRSPSPDSGSDESREERRKKRKRHSHKHSGSRSKHHRKHTDDSSEKKSRRHSKKRKSSQKHRSASDSD